MRKWTRRQTPLIKPYHNINICLNILFDMHVVYSNNIMIYYHYIYIIHWRVRLCQRRWLLVSDDAVWCTWRLWWPVPGSGHSGNHRKLWHPRHHQQPLHPQIQSVWWRNRVVLRKPVVVDHLRYEMMWCLPNCLGPMGLLQVNAYRVAIYIYIFNVYMLIYIYIL